MEKWNKALDIPVEILFKYLCRDYRREQARTAELEKKVEKLQAELNYERNNTPTVERNCNVGFHRSKQKSASRKEPSRQGTLPLSG